MSTTSPKSYIITQVSESATGANQLLPESSNQTSDVYSSVGVPSTSNFGNMSLIGVGIPTTKKTLDIQIQKSGTITREATFVWKDEAASDYRGSDDVRFMSGHRAPFSKPTVATTSDVPQACHGATAVYADFLKKEFLYYVKHVSNRNVVHVAHRTIDTLDEETISFTLADITLPLQFESSTGDLAQIDVCSTFEDTLLMVCAANEDLQLFESTDGLTWTLVASNLIKRFSSEDIDFSGFNLTSLKIASSGAYVRVVFASKNSSHNNFFCLASSDGGLSFVQTNIDANIRSDLALVDSYSNYAYAMDLCPIRESDGSFLLVVGYDNPDLFTSPSEKIETRTYVGVATADFSELSDNRIEHQRTFIISSLYFSKGFIVRYGKLFLCKTDTHIYLFDTGKVPLSYPNSLYVGGTTQNLLEMDFSHEIRIYRLPLDGIISSNKWESLNGNMMNSTNGDYTSVTNDVGVTGFQNGAGRYWFGRTKFYFIGNAVACFGTMVDMENAGIDVARHHYFRINNFSKSPVNDSFPIGYNLSAIPSYAGKHQPSGKLFDVQWRAIFGMPSDASHGLSNSSWIESTNSNILNQMRSQSIKMYILNDGSVTNYFSCNLVNNSFDIPFGGGGSKLTQGGLFFRLVVGEVEDSSGDGVAKFMVTSMFSGNSVSFEIMISEDKLKLREFAIPSSATTTTVFTDSDLGVGTTPFRDYFWEIRLVVEANPSFATISGNCRIFIRREGQSDFIVSNLIPYSINPSSSQNVSEVRFGLDASTAEPSPRMQVKELDLHYGSSLGMLDENGDAVTTDDSKLRGRSCNTLGSLLLDNNMKVVFGGGSSAEGDSYKLSTQDVYDVNNVTNSNQLNWQSTSDATDSTIVFESGKNAFIHNGWGIFGLNCKEVTIEYSNDSTFSTGVNTILNTNLSTGVVGRVDTVFESNQTVEITISDLSGFQDFSENGFVCTDKGNFYARFTALSASVTNIVVDQSFKIIDHFDNKFVLDGTSDILSATVGSTITIYSDRIVHKESSSTNTVKKYLRLTMGGSTFDGFHTLGSIVAGQVTEFNVPMDWSYTDQETANVQNNRSRSGVQWSYVEGPPVRTISGRIIGDVTQYQRSKMRTSLRKQRYSETPLVLVLEESVKQTRNPNNVIKARYTNEFAMDNAGWYFDAATETWYSVGDLSVTFEEDV